MLNKLVRIDPVDWQKLRDLYKENWPKHHLPFYTINNYLDWFQKDPKNVADIEIFSLNGDWSDGTYLIIDKIGLYSFCTLNENLNRLTQALCLIRERNLLFAAFVERIKPGVMDFFNIWNYECKSNQEKTVWYYLPKEQALLFDDSLPAGYLYKKLAITDATAVHEVWALAEFLPKYFIERSIRISPSLAIYDEKSNELLAWCLRSPFGFLGNLQVKETHMRKGLGSLVVRGLSKRIAELGHDVCAPVYIENTPSRKLLSKLGFKEFDQVYFMTYDKK